MYEEQRVHSIVVNDMMYIKEQVDTIYHFRCDFVMSEYEPKTICPMTMVMTFLLTLNQKIKIATTFSYTTQIMK